MKKVFPLPITKEQFGAILNAAETENEFDYMLFLTLGTTGRRIGELYGVQEKDLIGLAPIKDASGNILKRHYFRDGVPFAEDKMKKIYKKNNKWRFGVRVEDIDFEKGELKIWTLKRRKFTYQDVISLAAVTLRVLSHYINVNRLTEKDFVFRRPKRNLASIQKKLKYYAEKAKVPLYVEKEGLKYSLSLHSFRHYFITELQREGYSNQHIAKLTGHKDVKTLSIYSHTLATDFKEKMLPSLNRLVP